MLTSLEDYLTAVETPLEWVVRDCIPTPSFGLLVGAPKAGKSLAAIGLALAIVRGIPWMDRPTQQGPVLYLQLDASPPVWKMQLRPIRAAVGEEAFRAVKTVKPESIPYPFDVTRREVQDFLTFALDEAKPSLVILDVLREAHRQDENDSTAMRIVGDALMPLFKHHALLALHHSRKIPADVLWPDPMTYARGSNYIAGKVDYLWMLHRPANSTKGHLRFVPRWAEETRHVGVRDRATGLWDWGWESHVDPDDRLTASFSGAPVTGG